MNRTDRLQAILTHLQSKKVVTAQELAERFQLSLRTIYRDIKALEEAGIPIGAEAGIGYFINDNYTLPPIALTANEASALIFGAKLLAENSDSNLKRDFQNALFKIKAVLRPSEKEIVENISQHVEVLGTKSDKNLFITEIQQAIAKHRVIKINYKSLSNSNPTIRDVEPVGLCNYFSNWHLFAWCRLRKDYRDFRLDRIIDLEVTGNLCQKEDILSLDEFMKLHKPKDIEPNISFVVSENRHKFLDNYKNYYGFVCEEKIENGYKMYFASKDIFAIAVMILNSGCLAQNIQPKELNDHIKTLIKNTSDWYLK
ncbi:MAG: YafY family transcriptional regulator [Bacteroidales bacterium]|nr:YafY family transcriptional regulator [Bacteroidales bacterium]